MELGENWKGWKVVRVIGRGSFGTVYEIERDVLGTVEKAALKQITIPRDENETEELISDGYDMATISQRYDKYLKDIVREYTLMASLKGESNIVDCDDIEYVPRAGNVGWDIFIRMELLTSMAKEMDRYGRPEDAVRMGTDICRALELCGKKHIVHRDIKPQNIFVSSRGRYKLGDFGVAKVADHTTAGTRVGTFRYMAPEVYNGQPYGAAADVYSLGMVLYWMLNRRRGPFVPLPPAVPTVRQEEEAQARRLRGEPLPPPADGSEELKRIVLKACAYAPEDRYHDAGTMLADLKTVAVSAPVTGDETVEVEETVVQPGPSPMAAETVYMDMGPGPGTGLAAAETVLEEKATPAPAPAPQPVPRPVPQPASVPQPQPVPQPAPKKKKRGRVALVIAGVAVALLAAALAAVFALRDGREAENAQQGVREAEPVRGQATTIFAGFNQTVAVRSDGTVLTTGQIDDDLNDEVRGWTDIEAVSATLINVLGLRSDGTVAAVGYDGSGGPGDVGGWTDIVAVSAGTAHTAGLRSDGTVVAVGKNDDGRCDVGGWTDIVAVSVGMSHTVGLRSDGTVVAVGDDNYDQCDVSEWTDIVAVSAGEDYTVGLRRDGTVVIAGNNYLDRPRGWYDVSGWTDIVAISAGMNHTVGLRSDGTVVAVGNNSDGQCDVSGWTDIVAVSAGMTHTVGLRSDGTVVAVGSNNFGECDVSGWTDIRLPEDAGPTAVSAAAEAPLSAGQSSSGAAGAFPGGKPLSLLVPDAAGSPSDIIVRAFATELEAALGASVIVTNDTDGTCGLDLATNSESDGYTITYISRISASSLSEPIDPSTDGVRFLGRIMTDPATVTVRADSPFNTTVGFEDLIAVAREHPDVVPLGIPVLPFHATAVSLEEQCGGISFAKAPFLYTDVTSALSSSLVSAIITGAATVMEDVEAGRFKVLCVLDEDRSPFLPDVPTARELGYDVTGQDWGGFAVPENTPQQIVDILSDAAMTAICSDTVKDVLADLGYEQSYLTGAEMDAALNADLAAYREHFPDET